MAGQYGGNPFVAIAEDRPSDRIRFTLLHEVAHILAWRKEHNEKICQAFASEFLVPEDVLRRELSGRVRHSIAVPEYSPYVRQFLSGHPVED